MNKKLKMNITPVLISKNASITIAQTLNSLIEFNEVVVLDTGSTDNTMLIAAEYPNVKLYQSNFKGFGKSKNEAAHLAKTDWILSIDSDEVLTPDLLESIKNLKPENGTVYKFKRCNFYRQMPVKYSGWGKDFVLRLYNKQVTCFKENLVHEYVESNGLKVNTLKGNLNHFSYHSISDFSRKRELYSDLFAIENKGKRESSPLTAFFHSTFAFFQTFIIEKGFLDGYRGLLISVSNANVTFLKYIKLYEANLERNFIIREPFIEPSLIKQLPVNIIQVNKKQIKPELVHHIKNNTNDIADQKNRLLLLPHNKN